MNLTELQPGQQGCITALEGPSALKHRLAALGVLRGQSVRLRAKTLWGDPRAYLIGGQQICLRNADARHIRIQVHDD